MASGESTYKEALGAMIVSAKTRRMLLQLRSRHKVWGFFGGKKKRNETSKKEHIFIDLFNMFNI